MLIMDSLSEKYSLSAMYNFTSFSQDAVKISHNYFATMVDDVAKSMR